MKIKSIYVIGSLRNPAIPAFANKIQKLGIEAFADWHAAHKRADDAWKDYSFARGLNYEQAIQSYAARHIFEFDSLHLRRCDAAVLLMPAGKSAFLELGVKLGSDAPGYVVFPEQPLKSRWDVMLPFATKIFFSEMQFIDFLKR